MSRAASNRASTGRLALVASCLLACLGAAAQSLYYNIANGAVANNTLQRVGTNGSGNVLLFAAGGSVQRCTALAVDALNGKIFFSDALDKTLSSINLDGTGLSSPISTTNVALSLALDAANEQVYYAASSATQSGNTIARVDYLGQHPTTLFRATGVDGNGVRRCTAVAVDTVNSLIFVGDAGGNAIWSMDLTGSSLTKVGGGLAGAPLDLALDAANQVVYYVTSSATQTADTIQRIGYNGANGAVLFTATGSSGNGVQRCTSLDLDLSNARIYFSDAGSNALWRLPLAGGGATLVTSGLTAATVKKVRLFAPSTSGTNAHLSYSTLVANTPNLLGYWPFSPATQANSFDNGYTGSFIGAAAVGGTGSGPALFNVPGNTAVVLNGSSSYVNTSLVGGLSATGANADQGSIIGWFNLSVLPSTAGRFFYIAGESYYANDLDVQIETDNKIKFYTDTGSATADNTAFTAANLNTWIFFAATFNSNVSRNIYLNGALVASSAPAGAHNPAESGTFAMGASDVWSGRYFQGALDEIAIFNRELTATEISDLYAAGLGIAFIPLNIQQSGANLVVSWTDPTSLFLLQAAPTLGGAYSNVPGATSPYTVSSSGTSMFFRLKSQ